LDQLGKRLASLGPESVLHRGFTMITRPTGALVSHADELDQGDRVVTRFADGTVPMTVDDEGGAGAKAAD
jgi:exodeoxyribonuclease VII large subunit